MSVILVTGGAGFIGSHTCHLLLKNGFKIVILDSFINSSPSIINNLSKLNSDNFYTNLELINGDLRNKSFLIKLFENISNKKGYIDSVIHFAGLKSISESIKYPNKYWDVNVMGSINLFNVMEKFNCRKIIFSSSALVYKFYKGGNFRENSQLEPSNPYGKTKLIVENILKNLSIKSEKSWKVIVLRYFNPIGAHESGLLGELPKFSEKNLFPIICDIANSKKDILQIYGNDWETSDGTPIRDYIHIMDLATAHVEALKILENKNLQNFLVLNVGTGIGTSVLELKSIFEEVSKQKIPHKFVNRRNGDQAILIADNSLILKTLNWKPIKNVNEMCQDGWKFNKNK